MAHKDIPSFFYRFLRWFCNPVHFEEIQGDLEESFLINKEQLGIGKARSLYRIEVLKLLRPSVMRPVKWMPSGLKYLIGNYIVTSARSFRHHPFYISANVIGLAVALSITTIGYFSYKFNADFNTFYSDSGSLYKIHGLRTGESTVGTSPVALAENLRTMGYDATRYDADHLVVEREERRFQERVAFADANYLDLFPLKGLRGNTVQLRGSSDIIISQTAANKIFGEPYPLGESLELTMKNGKKTLFQVSDVFEDPPKNISFYFSMIVTMDNYIRHYEVDNMDWSNWVDATFVRLDPNDLQAFDTQIKSLLSVQNAENENIKIDRYRPDNILYWPHIEHDLYQSRFRGMMHPASVLGTVSSAIAILLLACFNFINTSIALSGRRLKEIAVRKVMGGSRTSTIAQFMVESFMFVAVALVLSALISYFLIPAYNNLFYEELVQLDKVAITEVVLFALGLLVVVGVISGAYPSLYVARFPSIAIFRNRIQLSGKNKLMVGLLMFQFALCFYNIFGLFLLVDNAKYQETLDRGYKVAEVINLPLNDPGQYAALEAELEQNTNIKSTAGTFNLIGYNFSDETVHHRGIQYPVAEMRVGNNYLQTTGVRLSKGFFFKETPAQHQVIINQMFENQVGTDLLGTSIYLDSLPYRVIGVVDDFNLKPIMLDNKIKPTVIRIADNSDYRYASIQVEAAQLYEMNEEMEDLWYSLFPEQLYQGFVQEEVLESLAQTNRIMISITMFLSIISLVISTIGLYTLISLIAQKRSKEFGIRKVLGAPIKAIFHQLGRDMYVIIGISAVIGLAGSDYVMTILFDIIYAYHLEPQPEHFLNALMTVILIVLSTVGYKVYTTARINPTEQLRNE